MAFELIRRGSDDGRIYWIMNFPHYGEFVFYGTDVEAVELFQKTALREGPGLLRKADPKMKRDQELVQDEIANVALDRRAGIKDLPYLPHDGGF